MKKAIFMDKLNYKDEAEYYHRCYKTVDGLWFMKAEEMFNSNTALELDQKVWNVMPKIQARFLKKKLGVNEGLDALGLCFSQKLKLDAFEFKTDKKQKSDKTTSIGFQISICPWYDILLKSKRVHLSDNISCVICGTEYKVWASEFGKGIKFSFGEKRICRGDKKCLLFFSSG